MSQSHVRYDALHSAVSYALQRTLDKLTLESFTSSYPNIDPKVLDFVRNQIIKAWSSKAELEFKKIFHERDLEVKLNELDDLILEAQKRYENSEFDLDITKLSSLELIKCASVPILRETNEGLRNQYDILKSSNDSLEREFNEMKNQFLDDFELIQHINDDIKSLDNYNKEEDDVNFQNLVSWCIEELAK